MNKGLAIVVSCALAAIAGLHLYWGIGGFWPGHDAASLVDMVVGARPGTPVPPFWACLVVAVCLLLPALSSMMIAYRVTPALPKFLACPRISHHLCSARAVQHFMSLIVCFMHRYA